MSLTPLLLEHFVVPTILLFCYRSVPHLSVVYTLYNPQTLQTMKIYDYHLSQRTIVKNCKIIVYIYLQQYLKTIYKIFINIGINYGNSNEGILSKNITRNINKSKGCLIE